MISEANETRTVLPARLLHREKESCVFILVNLPECGVIILKSAVQVCTCGFLVLRLRNNKGGAH